MLKIHYIYLKVPLYKILIHLNPQIPQSIKFTPKPNLLKTANKYLCSTLSKAFSKSRLITYSSLVFLSLMLIFLSGLHLMAVHHAKILRPFCCFQLCDAPSLGNLTLTNLVPSSAPLFFFRILDMGETPPILPICLKCHYPPGRLAGA